MSDDVRPDKPKLLASGRDATRFVWAAARRQFIMSMVAEALGAVALAGILLFGRQVVTALTADDQLTGLSDVLTESIGLGVSLAFAGLSAVVARQYRLLVGERVTRHVQEQIVDVASSVEYEWFERQDFNDQINRANARAAQSSYQLVYDVLVLFNVLATSIVIVLVLARTVPELLGILALIAVPSILAARASASLAYRTAYELTPNDRLRTYLYGALSGKRTARELRIFGLRDVLRERWSKLYDERIVRLRDVAARQVIFEGAAALIGAALVAAVLLVLVDAAASGRVAVGDAAIAIVALQQLTTRIRSASTASGSLRQSTLFLHEFGVFRGLGTAPPDEDRPRSTLPRGRLVVDRVSFRYPGTDDVVLHDISIAIEPGEIVALVGLSGSGKTTLAHLVAGLYQPTSGSITWDGTDIASFPAEVYWNSVGAVFQEFVRYELTARENVGMSDLSRIDDLDAISAAAHRAGIAPTIERLGSGYETMMSRSYTDGADLSVGQWQRVAVARAFFKQAPLLILDEPAAALDAVAEQQLYERLVELCETRSVLLISHRFSTVRLADRICVMEAGRIIEQGTHEELMRVKGRYAELFDLQARAYSTENSSSTSADVAAERA